MVTQLVSGNSVLGSLASNPGEDVRATAVAATWLSVGGGTIGPARADAGITPLESAAFHSSTEAADVLVAHGLHRPSLWLAAATGQTAELASWIDRYGALTRPAGPYRPDFADVGRPAGRPPGDDEAEILSEALVLAAANNRIEAVDFLLDVGVDIDFRPYCNTTGLHLAVQFHRPEMVEHLLARGADPTIEDDNHNSTTKGWAEASDDGSDAAARVRTLLSSR